MVRDDGRGTNGIKVWKTQNGDGLKLVSKYNTKVSILWDNRDNHSAWLKDANTIVVMHGENTYEFNKQ